jgi:type IV pilus assembly protein PilA
MNSILKLKLITQLFTKKNEKGFTLIELLVVVIILWILGAIALPNLISQVGKAKGVEGKNFLGAFIRLKQIYFFEKGTFPTPTTDIGSLVGGHYVGQYFTFNILNDGALVAVGRDNPGNGTRDSIEAASVDTNSSESKYIICESNVPQTNYRIDVSTDLIGEFGIGPGKSVACNPSTTTKIR